MLTPPPGFETWSAPEPREGWLDDGHTVDETRELFASRDLSVVASSQLEVACFGSPDAQSPTSRPTQRTPASYASSARTRWSSAPTAPSRTPSRLWTTWRTPYGTWPSSPEDLGVEIAIEFNWSPVVKSLQSGVRAAEIADHPRVGVLFDTTHYHVTPTKLSDINGDSVKWIKHVHLDDMPDTPPTSPTATSTGFFPGRAF